MPNIVTLIANPAVPCLTQPIADSAARLGGASFDCWLAEGVACDLLLPDDAPLAEVETALRRELAAVPVDLVIQPQEGRRRKVLLADMDSTMIGQECIDELADLAGAGDRVAEITARAMRGELEFEPALRERVALLSGLPASAIDEVLKSRIRLNPGAKQLVATMKKHGAHTVLVSGGFTAFTGPVAQMAGFDEHHGNGLIVRDGKITGEVAEPVLGREAKRETLLRTVARLELSPSDVLAVGDGANDLGMLQLAGMGVAIHAKPKVAAAARARIDHGDLTALLYLQGYRQDDMADIAE